MGDFINTLSGLIATALCLGGVIGPLGYGLLIQHLGFKTAFYAFAGISAVAAAIFVPSRRHHGDFR